MKRGSIHTAVLPGDYGKPRPILIVQSTETDIFDSLIVCPLTSDITTQGPLRVYLEPSDANGLREMSLIMVEKVGGLSKTRIRSKIGSVDPAVMHLVDERLAALLRLAD